MAKSEVEVVRPLERKVPLASAAYDHGIIDHSQIIKVAQNHRDILFQFAENIISILSVFHGLLGLQIYRHRNGTIYDGLTLKVTLPLL